MSIKLELEQGEVEQLLQALSKFPLGEVIQLFTKINQQAAQQILDNNPPVPIDT
jgi:hypothetical protein